MNDEYEIQAAFEVIQNELLDSMTQNLSKHINDELEINVQYNQWQADQLVALNNFITENNKIFPKKFTKINNKIIKLMKEYHKNGKADQEYEILKMLKKGYKTKKTSGVELEAIRSINKSKLNALILSTASDFSNAEWAMLRKVNDTYRKVIFNSQVYLNTGSGTLKNAIDMATRDFIAGGIDCIQYSDGRSVGITSYSEMALRTANNRAYVQGQSDMRDEWNIHTIIVTRRETCCPICAKWVGKILIDDVYGNGSSGDGDYPMLSEAMAAGLYHPNCKDTHTTYFEGITKVDKVTKKEQIQSINNYNIQQKQRYNERQIRKYKRLSDYSIDDSNKNKYKIKVKEWQAKQRQLQNQYPKIVVRDYSRESIDWL